MNYARMLLLRLLVVFSILVFSSPAQATNYITAVGVQQFTCTIASGSTTCTATVNAVGSGAFIIYGGINPSALNTAGEEQAYLTLTNSTTITGTRANGTAGTIVINGCIIDGDTINLIKSVQFGTISIAGGSATGTASITAVTNNNTATHYLGTSVNLSFSAAADFARLSLSGTTMTATINTANATGQTVGFAAIEFQGTALNQAIQNVSAASSGAQASWTATITSVVTGNAVLLQGGFTSGNGAPNTVLPNAQLTNGTTVTINVNTSRTLAATYNASVVEFPSGLLNSSVQRGTTTLSAATSNTATLSPTVVKGNSGITFLNNTTTQTVNGWNSYEGAVALTNGSTVTTTLNTAGTITDAWEVFEFPAFGGGAATGNSLNAIWFGSEF